MKASEGRVSGRDWRMRGRGSGREGLGSGGRGWGAERDPGMSGAEVFIVNG